MEGFGFASVLTMVFAGQVYLRYKEPDLPRPIRVRFYTKLSKGQLIVYGHFCWRKERNLNAKFDQK